MKPFYLLLIVFCILSCSSKNISIQIADVSNKLDRGHTHLANTDSAALDNSDIDFASFLKEFSSNKDFQLQRIDFPLKIILLDIEDQEEIQTISKEEWQHVNLLDTANIETIDVDAYSQKIEVGESEAIIKLRGIDNGIRINYKFQQRKRRWYLIEILNAST
ncbi:hypothetical protein C9994_07270 [Marivirga lumbricoides]|uniref:DUF4348 domain-containing protein n=1 Tax=Marivirga lumbricoides TaxID=1046115 RepID=A0A2T4DRL6_9BACT|nr:hypothetical protein C9994_07270 [Marivirga lumbricoides]